VQPINANALQSFQRMNSENNQCLVKVWTVDSFSVCFFQGSKTRVFLKSPTQWGFIGFFGQAGKIGKIIQKLSNLKP